jgi:ABC-type transport system involved in cytochrome c biogenesis permease subunit
MFKCSLINIYFLTICILPGISVLIYLIVPVQTVKVFGGNIDDQSTRDAAELWVRTTSNGDILVSLLNGIAFFKQSDWHFRQIVIRVCSISNFIHFGCFLCHHYFVKPHHIGFVVMYYSALSLTLLTGLCWGLNWDTILKKSKTSDEIQLTNESNSASTSTKKN